MVKDKEVNHVRERTVLFCRGHAKQFFGGGGHPQIYGFRFALSQDELHVFALSIHCVSSYRQCQWPMCDVMSLRCGFAVGLNC